MKALGRKLPPSSAPSPSEPPSGVRPCAVDPDEPARARATPEHESANGAAPPDHAAAFDERAFTEFVKVQVGRTPEYARKLHLLEHEAEDIRQRALKKLWLHRAEVGPPYWEAWLWSAMRFRSLVYFRGVRRARKHEFDLATLLQESQSCASPEAEVYQRQCARDLLALLDRLTPRRREVVCLYLIDDLPMKEVAEQLGIKVDTAKNRWRLACKDMGMDFGREDAKSRTRAVLARIAAVAALLVAFWRRIIARAPPRGRYVLACAACALACATHEDPPAQSAARLLRPPPVAGNVEPAAPAPTAEPAGLPPGSAERASATPPQATAARRPVAVRSPAAGREAAVSSAHAGATPPRTVDPVSAGLTALQIDAAHKHLAGVTALYEKGRIEGARRLLNLYRLCYPVDPLPREYAQLAAALTTP